jgi:hypothetical protein
MKRLLLVVLALAMVCGVVGATQIDFQYPADLNLVNCTGTCAFVQNATGGNSWMSTTGGMKNLNPLQTTYAALSSSVATNNYNVLLLDANMNTIVGYGYGGGGDGALPNTRFEIIIRGGYAYLYTNGVQVYSGGNQSIALNPSYIYFSSVNAGTHRFDDFVYGDSENLYVVAQPSYTGYKLVKDFITPASSGLRYNNDTVVSSTSMFYRVARGNTTIPAPT